METREGSFSFGADMDNPFRLHIRVDVQGHRHPMLLHREVAVPSVPTASLALLQFFVENPKEIIMKAAIQDALRLENFDKSLSALRQALDDDWKHPKFIETLGAMNSYRFMLDVVREGDLGIEALPRWRPGLFSDLLNNVTRGAGEEDLRIVTVAFGCGIQELGLDRLLKKGARVHIVMMDPKEKNLLEARHGLREDTMTPAQGKVEIERQIGELRNIAQRARDNKYQGELKLKLSKAMPAGFVVHSRRRAIVGLFLATCSYSHGPMIEVHHDTDVWQKLYDDWFARWRIAADVDLLNNPTPHS
jgi:hypothetical protein